MTADELLGLLRDTAQGASNSAASTVSAPVDVLAWLLRKGGVPVGPAPVLGSDWMAQKGLTAQPKNALAGMAGETIGNILPIVAAAKAPQIANALLRADEALQPAVANALEQYMVKQGMIQPATVWHGSPHKFDKFDASKIGTGEGAQAYGHGLYLAESPTVATGYKETLAQRVKDRLTIDGKVVDPDSMLGRAAEDIPRIGLQATLQKIDDNIKFNAKYAPDMAEMYRGIREKIASLDPSRVAVKEGSLYKVDLPDEAIARMLDWDKPLSQQAPEVLAALQKSRNRTVKDALAKMNEPGQYSGELMDGAGLVRLLSMNTTGKQIAPQASQAIQKAGIPGIRYLDGGSRGAGQGTSNYVVFPGEESLLTILERNGVPMR